MIGIFLILVSTYWFVYGHIFEGPVSPLLSMNVLCFIVLTNDLLQKFDTILGHTQSEIKVENHQQAQLAPVSPVEEKEKSEA